MYLLSAADQVSYTRNDVIIRHSEMFQYMYVIQEGQVRVVTEETDNKTLGK
jgi:CRP-like cAMP-binding protein